MSSPSSMTTTSYAILGLLAVKPWRTHELVRQVDHSLRRIWPRATSKLYEEPKKLVAHGYARAADDSVGRRPRTRYTITAEGRRALAAWLSEPGEGPVLECEQLVKVHLGDHGTKADIVANLEAMRSWVLAQNEENLATARAYLEGRGAFPERAALNQLPGRFLTEYYLMVARWVRWATDVVEAWPDDVTRAPFDVAAAEEGVRLAQDVVTLLERDTVSSCLPNRSQDGAEPSSAALPAVLTDAQWARLAPLLPSSAGRRGRQFRDDRRVVEGILYRFRNGLPWRDVPAGFGPWQTLWKRYRRYRRDGTWDRVLAPLLADTVGVE
ncbi:transposase [Pseudonocardia sp. C8]|uniref:transposase n=1 Tax=Pseudonocardia sp. C8 TaxID=2762759 RepID=UPI001642A297|nr:transposase [Pseudonocardia sp. C8]MBC3192209.1 transposase [Pseudonocardia sp. C8]